MIPICSFSALLVALRLRFLDTYANRAEHNHINSLSTRCAIGSGGIFTGNFWLRTVVITHLLLRRPGTRPSDLPVLMIFSRFVAAALLLPHLVPFFWLCLRLSAFLGLFFLPISYRSVLFFFRIRLELLSRSLRRQRQFFPAASY